MGALQTTASSDNFKKIQIDRTEMGRADTLRYNVQVYVVEENYDRAIEELKKFQEAESEYPNFKKRVERYISHSIDLVNAIRAKRRFPGVHTLTMAKQQEIIDRFHDHFNELQTILKKIEKVQHNMKMEDIRSTILVVRALVHAAFAIAILAFILEGARGLVVNALVVSDDALLSATDFIFKHLGI